MQNRSKSNVRSQVGFHKLGVPQPGSHQYTQRKDSLRERPNLSQRDGPNPGQHQLFSGQLQPQGSANISHLVNIYQNSSNMAPQNPAMHHQKPRGSKFQNHFSERNNSEMNTVAASQLKQTVQNDGDVVGGSLLPSSILSNTQQKNGVTEGLK